MEAMKPPCRPTTVGTAGWTQELRELCREANRLRRRKQRAYRKAPEILEARKAAYSEACRALGRAMFRARTEAWRELCGGLDTDMWVRPYRVVMARLKAKVPPPLLSKRAALRVLEGLFPTPEDETLRRNPLSGI